jgi:hypothetical protein
MVDCRRSFNRRENQAKRRSTDYGLTHFMGIHLGPWKRKEKKRKKKQDLLRKRYYICHGKKEAGEQDVHSFCNQSNHREYNNLQNIRKENEPR